MPFTSKQARHLHGLILSYIEHPTAVKLDLIRRALRAGALFHEMANVPNEQQWQSFIHGVGEAIYQTVSDERKNPLAAELARFLEKNASNDVKHLLLYQLAQSDQLLQEFAAKMHRTIVDYLNKPTSEKLAEIDKQVDHFNRLHSVMAALQNPGASAEERSRVGSEGFIRKHNLRNMVWTQQMLPYFRSLCTPLALTDNHSTYYRLNAALDAHGSTALFEILPQQLNSSSKCLPTTGNEVFRKLIAHLFEPSRETFGNFASALNIEQRSHLTERSTDGQHSLFQEALAAILEKYKTGTEMPHETASQLAISLFTLFTENLSQGELVQLFFVPSRDGQLPIHLFIRLANQELVKNCMQLMYHLAQNHRNYDELYAALTLSDVSAVTTLLGNLLIAADVQTRQCFSRALMHMGGFAFQHEIIKIQAQLERITAQHLPDIIYSPRDPAMVSLIDEFRIVNPDSPSESIKLVISAEKLAQLQEKCAVAGIALNSFPDQRTNMFLLSLEYGRKYHDRGIEPDVELVLTELLKVGVITPAFRDHILASEQSRQRQSSIAKVVSAQPQYEAEKLYPRLMHFAPPSVQPTRVEPITPNPSLVGEFGPGK